MAGNLDDLVTITSSHTGSWRLKLSGIGRIQKAQEISIAYPKWAKSDTASIALL